MYTQKEIERLKNDHKNAIMSIPDSEIEARFKARFIARIGYPKMFNPKVELAYYYEYRSELIDANSERWQLEAVIEQLPNWEFIENYKNALREINPQHPLLN